MTKSRDIQELIAEHSSGREESRRLEATAEALADSLSRPVPYRPEFKAELRARLLAEARQKLTPWYRRPAVWGTSMGLVAASVMLAVGLQVYKSSPQDPGVPGVPPVSTPTKPPGTKDVTEPVPTLVNYTTLPVVALPDEPAGAEAPTSNAGLDPAKGLRYYQVTVSRSSDQVARIARGIGMPEPQSADQFTVTEGARRLEVTPDGTVLYEDRAPETADPNAQKVDRTTAVAVAQSFLDRASLQAPTLDATVTEPAAGSNPPVYVVRYTPKVDGRPIVNERTELFVTERGKVLKATAYLPHSQDLREAQNAFTPEQAVEEARKGGGTFTNADMVYVRTVDPNQNGAVFYQPYWRVFGTDAKGQAVVRYVPALLRRD